MLTKMIKVNWILDRTKKKTKMEEGYKKGVQTAEQYKRQSWSSWDKRKALNQVHLDCEVVYQWLLSLRSLSSYLDTLSKIKNVLISYLVSLPSSCGCNTSSSLYTAKTIGALSTSQGWEPAEQITIPCDLLSRSVQWGINFQGKSYLEQWERSLEISR